MAWGDQLGAAMENHSGICIIWISQKTRGLENTT